ncbi:NAD(P)-dependent oxidoreductase [Ferrimicrobium sp.]|uniref:NAD-dependent epimerase/dehydratase family protein n=1 Tax=Ferrimicrobium sp. TaxID=2926050 RepID=UPI00260F3A0C|nr:NAD(P)-dependent oxidoreductase [Ferrimicrobium sp.]
MEQNSARRHVVVTGGSGFIGTHLVKTLQRENSRVAIVDRNQPRVDGVDHFVRGAIEDPSTWVALARALPDGADTLVHLAARTSVLESIKDPADVFASNLVGFHHALEFCRLHGVPRVILASTNAVVGMSGGTDLITELSPLAPLTPYGASKAADEMLGSAYSECYGVRVAAVRLTNVYGPDMWRKDSIVPRLFRYAQGKGDFAVYGDGTQFRDFVYVEDVVRAFLSLADSAFAGPVSFGSGESVSVNELVSLVGQVVGKELHPDRVPAKTGEMPGVRVSLERAHTAGLKADVNLGEGLGRAWRDFLASSQ